MKLIYKLSLFILFISVVVSCKKGPEDPGVSFRSRKARLTGKWQGTSYNSELTSVFSPSSIVLPTSTKETLTSDQTNILIKTENSNKTIDATGTIEFHELEFTKDGEFFYSFKYTTTSTYQDTTLTGEQVNYKVVVNKTINKKGKWAFTGKFNGDKNKENVLLSLESNKENISTETTTTIASVSTTTTVTNENENLFAPGENSEIWQIVKLKNKELKLQSQVDNQTSGKNIVTTALGTSTTDLPIVSISGTKSLFFKQ